tara:strand:+ start:4231 stop:4536 length:306 start_codon:yes stop_codon:yes gene_type:complete
MGGSSKLNDKIFITCNPVDETGNIINDFKVDKDGNFIGNLAKEMGHITDLSTLLNGNTTESKGVGFLVGLILIFIIYYIGKYVFKKMAEKIVDKTETIREQ